MTVSSPDITQQTPGDDKHRTVTTSASIGFITDGQENLAVHPSETGPEKPVFSSNQSDGSRSPFCHTQGETGDAERPEVSVNKEARPEETALSTNENDLERLVGIQTKSETYPELHAISQTDTCQEKCALLSNECGVERLAICQTLDEIDAEKPTDCTSESKHPVFSSDELCFPLERTSVGTCNKNGVHTTNKYTVTNENYQSCQQCRTSSLNDKTLSQERSSKHVDTENEPSAGILDMPDGRRVGHEMSKKASEGDSSSNCIAQDTISERKGSNPGIDPVSVSLHGLHHENSDL